MGIPNPHALAGRRVVVTRSTEQAAEMVQQLQQLGAEVMLLPSLAFAEPDDTRAVDAAIHSLASFDWLVFTSANAVRFFCTRVQEIGRASCRERVYVLV